MRSGKPIRALYADKTRVISVLAFVAAVIAAAAMQGQAPQPRTEWFAAELSPATFRYSGASLSITLGTLLGGAITPIVATALYAASGSSWPITALPNGNLL
jgi:hypothetical protein